jgi:hypothetical protein
MPGSLPLSALPLPICRRKGGDRKIVARSFLRLAYGRANALFKSGYLKDGTGVQCSELHGS